MVYLLIAWWIFPWRTVSHNQMVINNGELWPYDGDTRRSKFGIVVGIWLGYSGFSGDIMGFHQQSDRFTPNFIMISATIISDDQQQYNQHLVARGDVSFLRFWVKHFCNIEPLLAHQRFGGWHACSVNSWISEVCVSSPWIHHHEMMKCFFLSNNLIVVSTWPHGYVMMV